MDAFDQVICRTDQWSIINQLIIDTLRAHQPIGPMLRDLQFGEYWQNHVISGRGKGRPPKPPFHGFRKYGPEHMGEKYNQWWEDLEARECEICLGRRTKFRRIFLDHYAFYTTGEIFTWLDPKFLIGHIPVDPREYAPDHPILPHKLICEDCFKERQDESLNLVNDYNRRWERLSHSQLPVINLKESQRVLRDRRVSRSAYLEWFSRYNYTENFQLRTVGDRRSAARRSTDVGPTWGQVLDSRDSRDQRFHRNAA